MYGSIKRRRYTLDEVLDELQHSDKDSGDDFDELLIEEFEIPLLMMRSSWKLVVKVLDTQRQQRTRIP